MTVFTYLLMGFLILCAIAVSLSKNLLNSILIYMSYSLIMSIIWTILESDYVCPLGVAAVSGSGNYRGRSWCRCDKYSVFCYVEKDTCN